MSTCRMPLIEHRPLQATECPNPNCDGGNRHRMSMPCRWAGPFAHGVAIGGKPFPAGRCKDCAHIKRAGKPEVDLVSA